MSTKASPIKPEDIQDLKNFDIPSEMIEAVNELIIKNWNGSSATFKQKDLIPVYLSKVKDKEKARDMLFEHRHLDFEDRFRQAGWKVHYDKPGYNENYDSFWEFEKKKK